MTSLGLLWWLKPLDRLVFNKKRVSLIIGICSFPWLEVTPLIGHIWSVKEAWSHGFGLLGALLICGQVVIVGHIEDEDVFDGFRVALDLLLHLIYLPG